MAGFHVVAGHGPDALRQRNDYYPTPPGVTRALLLNETFPERILEPCAGEGHVVRTLREAGYRRVLSNEPFVEGAAWAPDRRVDFLTSTTRDWRGCRSIVTNPPYRLARQFIEKALTLGIEKHAWLLRFQFGESEERYPFFRDHPPARVYLFSERVNVGHVGLVKVKGGMIAYAWWVWEPSRRRRQTELRWLEPGTAK